MSLPTDIEKFLGSKIVEEMRKTKWYAFARVIDHCLYYGGIEDKTFHPIFGYPNGVDIPGVRLGEHRNTQVDLRRVMRELQHECERMALLEATS